MLFSDGVCFFFHGVQLCQIFGHQLTHVRVGHVGWNQVVDERVFVVAAAAAAAAAVFFRIRMFHVCCLLFALLALF